MHVKKILETNPELQLKTMQNKIKAMQEAKRKEREAGLKNLLNI